MGHIPGSAFLDLQGSSPTARARFNFTMPALDDLAARFAAKGIGEGTRVVLYSRGSMQWATRVWWMLRRSASTPPRVLDGGFDKWSAEGRPTETAETRYPPATLAARPRPGLFVGKDEVRAAIGDAGTCTINALAPDLHRGDNPRYGRPGRVPGSVNVPALALVDAAR
jgi:thiosulfate/3-mercaptopyruvate sulfurtransferase